VTNLEAYHQLQVKADLLEAEVDALRKQIRAASSVKNWDVLSLSAKLQVLRGTVENAIAVHANLQKEFVHPDTSKRVAK
jgi:hypothetical protein